MQRVVGNSGRACRGQLDAEEASRELDPKDTQRSSSLVWNAAVLPKARPPLGPNDDRKHSSSSASDDKYTDTHTVVDERYGEETSAVVCWIWYLLSSLRAGNATGVVAFYKCSFVRITLEADKALCRALPKFKDLQNLINLYVRYIKVLHLAYAGSVCLVRY